MLNRTRILIIDDDPLFRSLMASLLRKDFFVSVASEGSEGFYKALEHPPDIAVIDIRMPGWDGLQTLKAFRSHPQLRAVKTVILTSDASKETVVAAIRGGADDYVIKTSFSKEEFYQKLEKLRAEKTARTPFPSSLGPVESDTPDATLTPTHSPPLTMYSPTLPAADSHQPPQPEGMAQPTGAARPEATVDTLGPVDQADEKRLQELIDGWE